MKYAAETASCRMMYIPSTRRAYNFIDVLTQKFDPITLIILMG
jgi:hypothetical protein